MEFQMGLCVIVVGNPFDGMRMFGPYKKRTKALAAAEQLLGEDWWVVQLEAPEELVVDK